VEIIYGVVVAMGPAVGRGVLFSSSAALSGIWMNVGCHG
jgi:hypothetical protein